MKVRRVDLSPSEFIAGVSGQLTPVEFAVYWELCLYIYDKGDSILDDAAWLSRLYSKADPRTIRSAVDSLVAHGKVTREMQEIGGRSVAVLMVNRCRSEIEKASKRMRDARDAAHERWNNKDVANAIASHGAVPSLSINHQPSTINHQVMGDARAQGGLRLGNPDDTTAAPTAGRAERAPAKLLASDWSAEDALRDYARNLGLDDAAIDREAVRFRAYFVEGRGAGKKRTPKGWRQTWFNWVARAIDGGTDQRRAGANGGREIDAEAEIYRGLV